MLGHAGPFSIQLAENLDVPTFVNALNLFKLGVSWGGHESLVMTAKASLDHSPADNAFADFGVSPQLVRIHIGLENVEYIWADLKQAFSAPQSDPKD